MYGNRTGLRSVVDQRRVPVSAVHQGEGRHGFLAPGVGDVDAAQKPGHPPPGAEHHRAGQGFLDFPQLLERPPTVKFVPAVTLQIDAALRGRRSLPAAGGGL